jgi:hypothetical protein
MSNIESIVEELSDSYHLEKASKKTKDKLRLQFFKEVTESFSEGDLAEDLAVVEASSEGQAKDLIEASYPAYDVVAVSEHPDLEGKWEGIIRENPEYKSFSIEVGEEIWQRQTVVGSPTVDDVRLALEDPELYELVTEVPTERVMKSLKDIDEVALARLQKFVKSGKVSVKLPAPKESK